MGYSVPVFKTFPFCSYRASFPNPEDQALRAKITLTLKVEVGTVGVGMALPIVLQAAVDGRLLWLTVQPVSHVMTFTFTFVLALEGEQR